MDIERKINLDIKKLVKHTVGNNKDFHFYIDELSSDNGMPTYRGKADEKYSFEEMNDDFFDFLEEKRNHDGIYIRLIFAEGINTTNGAEFNLTYCGRECTFKTNDIDDVFVFDFADFGVKVQGDTVTFGATVDDGCSGPIYFAEFGSGLANDTFLGRDNPLNRCVMKIMDEILVQL